MNAHQTKIPQT